MWPEGIWQKRGAGDNGLSALPLRLAAPFLDCARLDPRRTLTVRGLDRPGTPSDTEEQ